MFVTRIGWDFRSYLWIKGDIKTILAKMNDRMETTMKESKAMNKRIITMIGKIDKKKICFFTIISWLILIISFCILIFFVDKKIDCLINDDMSGDLTLGYLLSKSNNPILTKEYLYTTEVRVIHTAQIYGLVFRFCNDWHNVRVISTAIIYLLILASYYFLCRQAGIKKYFAISAALYLLPLSNEYADWFLFPMYYAFHFVATFLTLGLMIKYVKSKNKFVLMILAVFSFLMGLNGIRVLLVLTMPLLACSIIYYFMNRKKDSALKFVIASALTFFISVIGVGIYVKVIEPTYGSMKTYFEITDLKYNNLAGTIQGYLYLLGYSTGHVTGAVIISNLFCLITVILITSSIILFFKRKEENSIQAVIITGYFICAVLLFEGLYFVTDMEYATRYCLPFFIANIPLVLVIMNENKKISELQKMILCLLVMGFAILIAKDKYFSFKYLDNTKEIREITEYLLGTEYLEGYMGTSCALTEFSNGILKVYGWKPGDYENQKDIDIIEPYNQPRERLDRKPEGGVFVIMDKASYSIWTFRDVITLDYLIYETDGKYVFGFDSYDFFKSLTLQSENL